MKVADAESHKYASELAAHSTAHGMPYWFSFATILRHSTSPHTGETVDKLEQGNLILSELVARGERLDRSFHLLVLANSYGYGGNANRAFEMLTRAFCTIVETEERWTEPELYRVQGMLRLSIAENDQREPEACFQRALEVARNQQAKSWELRAATSLARLWQSQGKTQAAHDLLASVYDWFTEGFDTADLKEAKALLDELK